jgi:glycosyltransferase involved in cell wall biosynthesis
MTNQAATRRPRVCVVSTTPQNINAFFCGHLSELSKVADVVLALNPATDPHTPRLNLPASLAPIGIRRQISIWHDLMTLLQLLRLFRRERFDLVWAVAPKAGLLGMLAAWLTRVPKRVFIFQGEVWAARQGLNRKILKQTDRITARVATHLLGVSVSGRSFLEAERIVEVGRIEVLASGSVCGVDLQKFIPDVSARQRIRIQHDIPADAVVALFVGRLTRDKGIYDLVEAFRNLAPTSPHLWLMVLGPDEEGLAPQLLSALGPLSKRCRIIEFKPDPECYMAAADFVCLPSYREGFGMVIIESGATGVPSIASRIHGLTDALEEGMTGLMHEPGDVAGLSECIRHFAADAELRMRMGRAAQQRSCERFSAAHVRAAFAGYFRKLLEAQV